MPAVYARNQFVWDGLTLRLHLGKRVVALVVPDPDFQKLYRVVLRWHQRFLNISTAQVHPTDRESQKVRIADERTKVKFECACALRNSGLTDNDRAFLQALISMHEANRGAGEILAIVCERTGS